MVVFGVITPVSKPAMPRKGFRVDPGGYWPLIARLNKGCMGERARLSYVSESRPVTNRLGSKLGMVAKARISPDWGDRATRAPRLSASSAMAFCCKFESMVRVKVFPEIGFCS